MTVETKQGSAIEAVQRLRPIIEHYRDEAERERACRRRWSAR